MMRFINTLIYSNHKGIRILRHVLFWLVDMVNWLMVKSINSEVTLKDVSFFLLNVPLAMAATYLILYYFIPKFSSNKKGTLFFSIILVLFIMGCSFRIYKFSVVSPLLELKPILMTDLWNLAAIISEIFKWLAVICMAVALKLIKSKAELQEKNEQLLNEKRMAELSFLKAQMHPHFLFNTLNTLYSETIQNSEKAGLVVVHLSNLLRFILEECNKPLITLEKELKVIKDYIELEKLRHGARLDVTLTVASINQEMLISPLLFLPIVENSFKHSLNHVRGLIRINILVGFNNEQFQLTVENDHAKGIAAKGLSGKGIANIKRQLELLYENHYQLEIIESETKYRVNLTFPNQSKFTNA